MQQDNKLLIKQLNLRYGFSESTINNVDPEIYQDDDMYEKGKEEHYFNVGFSCLKTVTKALSTAEISSDKIKNILDFPSGYGRELRFFTAYFPGAKITAGEISSDKLKFVKDKFHTDILFSQRDYSKINPENKFDLIWCGSLFTHLSSRYFFKLLEFFNDNLNKDGILLFTTHGRYSHKNFKTYGLRSFQRFYIKFKYRLFGFGYSSYLKQFRYGVSLSSPSWVIKQIEKFNELKILGVMEKEWDKHQDVFICQKKDFINNLEN